jgi:hypothetical protein
MGIFDDITGLFTGSNSQAAAQAQIAGINAGLTSATNAINTGSQDLTTNYTAALQPYLQNYNQATQGTNAYASALGLNGGAAGAQAAAAAYASNPAYQFQLQQGTQNVLRNAAQTGTTASGATLSALQTQGQGLANSTYQQYVQNLQPFLNQANTAASGIGSTYTGLGNQLNANQGSLANLNYTAATGIGNANANADLALNSAGANSLNALLSAGSLGASLFSDARLKEDIEPVGELYDGTNIYRYRYKGDDTPRIGVMAQEVEKTNPDAVIEVGGYKAVDYSKATQFASELARFAKPDVDNVVPIKPAHASSYTSELSRFLEAA